MEENWILFVLDYLLHWVSDCKIHTDRQSTLFSKFFGYCLRGRGTFNPFISALCVLLEETSSRDAVQRKDEW